jgi:hypothetical protein
MGSASQRVFSAIIGVCCFGLLATTARRAAAVVIGDPAALAGTPTPAGFSYVGQVDGASGVYVGNGWVLTAAHVGVPTGFTLGGSTYNVSAGSPVELTNPNGTPTDLQLFKLTSSPALTNLNIPFDSPGVNTLIYDIGFGAGRSGNLTNFGDMSNPEWGFAETAPGTEIWGTNDTIAVDGDGNPDSSGNAIAYIQVNGDPGPIYGFFTQFYSDLADYNNGGNGTGEAQIAGDDSGGGVFDSNGDLIGIMDGNASQIPGDAILGDASAYVDVAEYRQQIDDITGLPEPTTIGVLSFIAVIGLGRRVRPQ